MGRRRGFLLIMCLLMASLVLVMGMGFLSGGSPRYNGAIQARTAAQARALADAGMEDARVKMQKDPLFPPPGDSGQTIFCYRENVTDITNTTVVGAYVVTVDTTYLKPPYCVALVTSQGLFGVNPASPEGSYVLHAEFDMHPINPAAPNPRDPNYARIVNWWEENP